MTGCNGTATGITVICNFFCRSKSKIGIVFLHTKTKPRAFVYILRDWPAGKNAISDWLECSGFYFLNYAHLKQYKLPV